MQGFIYVRVHNAYGSLCKLDKTLDLIEQDKDCISRELHRGKFVIAFCIPADRLDIIEKLLNRYFKSLGLHFQSNGGTKFYEKSIIPMIEEYLQKLNVNYTKLSEDEIMELTK
jgi:hypothetical protein